MEARRPYFKTVYYSDFWYSRHFKSDEVTVAGNVINDEIGLHKFRLRILSLFFESLYIPRTHLITSVFREQYKIADKIIDSYEFGTLFEAHSVRVSTYPHLDANEDNLRILDRQAEAPEIIYPDDKRYLEKIPITRKFVVDTSRESASNTTTFPQYGDLLQAYNPEIGRRYHEIVQRSNLKDIPFFHEKFLKRIREEMPRELFEAIWRNTNSIYLTSGAPEHKSFIAYFNEEIEHPSFRFQPHGIDRYLFSPATLYTFLGIFLSHLQLSRVLHNDMRLIHRPLLDETMHPSMCRFRREYQQIAWAISEMTRDPRLHQNLDQQGLKVLFELALDADAARLTQLIQEAIADAESVTHSHGGFVGLAGAATKLGSKYATRFFRDRARRRRFPALYDIIDRLADSTKEG